MYPSEESLTALQTPHMFTRTVGSCAILFQQKKILIIQEQELRSNCSFRNAHQLYEQKQKSTWSKFYCKYVSRLHQVKLSEIIIKEVEYVNAGRLS